LAALNNHGKIITDMIQESKYILGEQPELLAFSNENDQQERFLQTILDFFAVISTGKTLTLFLDDLQWADTPSLQLIVSMIKRKNINVLLIGAYRDNEITPTHQMVKILGPVIEERSFKTVTLDNLKIECVEEILRDSLKSNKVEELAELVFKMTIGNPFFIKEFIFNLYDKKLIKFNYETEEWNWDLKKIETTKFSENVVDFMVNNLKEYSEKTKRILNRAACIGNTFSLEMLSLVYEKSPADSYKDLLEPIRLGWIFEDKNSFKFVHDRLQQSAYEIYDDKQQIHFQIGMKMLEKANTNNQLDEFIFDIVNNLNKAGEYFKDKVELIQLNLRAGNIATKNFAFHPALSFSKIAKSLLNEDSWETHHELCFEVHTSLAHHHYLIYENDESSKIYDELLKNTKTDFETLQVTFAYVNLLTIIFNFEKGLELTFKLFDLYDISKEMPRNDLKLFDIWLKNLFDEIFSFMKNIKTEREFLDAIPKQSNEEISLLTRYYTEVALPILYQICLPPQFSVAVLLMGVKLVILHGNNDTVASLLAATSWFVQAYYVSPEPQIMGKLATEMMKNIKNPSLLFFTKFYTGLSAVYDQSPTDAIQLLEYCHLYGHSIGEKSWGSYAYFVWSNYSLLNGCNYESCYQKLSQGLKSVYAANHMFIGDTIECNLQTIGIITGKLTSFSPNCLIPGFDNIPWGRYNYYFHKALSLFLLKDYIQAKEASDKINEFTFENMGLPHYPDTPFYRILINYELFTSENDSLPTMKENFELIKKYHDLNPQYFDCRYYLAKALIESLSKEKNSVVFESFENAINTSSKSPWIEAFSFEYFSKFCEKQSIHKEFSKSLIHQALNKWKNMNVVCKSQYISVPSTSSGSSSDSKSESSSTLQNTSFIGSTTSIGSSNVDLHTVIKSSSALTEDLDKEKLLEKLAQVIVENAGADKGFIILNENQKYFTHCEVSSKKCWKRYEEITTSSEFLSLKIFNQCLNQREMIIFHNAKQELKTDSYVQRNEVKSVLCAPILKGKSLSGILYLENNSMVGAFTESRKFIMKHVLSQVAISIENSNLFADVKTINEAYARFLPKEFLKQLGKKDVRNVQLSDSVEKKMTILFSDIRNFTSITDKMDSKESFQFVNEILSKLAPPISANNGFVDKFIGDCVMAIFPGSPLDGVKAGVQMLERLKILNENRKVPVNIGVGLAYGNVMIGTLGFEKRLDATVISSTVNTASRLESLTKTLGVNLIVTEEIYELIQHSIDMETYFLGSFYLKGQENAKKLYEVYSKENIHFDVETFNKGVDLFSQKKFKESVKIFENLKAGIADYYIKVCKLYESSELPINWKGEIKISKDGDAELLK
jgi:class 3 adenylate cyclase